MRSGSDEARWFEPYLEASVRQELRRFASSIWFERSRPDGHTVRRSDDRA